MCNNYLLHVAKVPKTYTSVCPKAQAAGRKTSSEAIP
jgi:hypothetical protein